jgi:uncharacterized protein HemX
MENTLSPAVPQSNSDRQLLLFVIAALLSLLCYQAYDHVQRTQKDRVNMEKSSGRSGKHSNPKARQSAEEQFEKVKQEYEKLSSKTKKSKEDVKQWNKLKKQLEHWRKKKDWKGEQHSQKHKGK